MGTKSLIDYQPFSTVVSTTRPAISKTRQREITGRTEEVVGRVRQAAKKYIETSIGKRIYHGALRKAPYKGKNNKQTKFSWIS